MSYSFIRGHLARQQFIRDQQRRLVRQKTINDVKRPTFEQIIDQKFLFAVTQSLIASGQYKAGGPDGVRYADLSISNAAAVSRDLHEALANGSWEPSIARAVNIPKGENDWRTLLIRSIATAIVAAAVQLKLSPYWETIFLDSSYGFRPGRGIND